MELIVPPSRGKKPPPKKPPPQVVGQTTVAKYSWRFVRLVDRLPGLVSVDAQVAADQDNWFCIWQVVGQLVGVYFAELTVHDRRGFGWVQRVDTTGVREVRFSVRIIHV